MEHIQAEEVEVARDRKAVREPSGARTTRLGFKLNFKEAAEGTLRNRENQEVTGTSLSKGYSAQISSSLSKHYSSQVRSTLAGGGQRRGPGWCSAGEKRGGVWMTPTPQLSPLVGK